MMTVRMMLVWDNEDQPQVVIHEEHEDAQQDVITVTIRMIFQMTYMITKYQREHSDDLPEDQTASTLEVVLIKEQAHKRACPQSLTVGATQYFVLFLKTNKFHKIYFI